MRVTNLSFLLLLVQLLLPCVSSLANPTEHHDPTHHDSSDCLRVSMADQDLLMEQWGDNAVRVRAVPKGDSIRDDLVSALVERSSTSSSSSTNKDCRTLDHHNLNSNNKKNHNDPSPGTSLVSGNLRVTVANDGRLEFVNIEENRVILQETKPRQFHPKKSITTTSEAYNFYSLDVHWDSPAHERLYGLGQHKLDALNYKSMAPLQLSMVPWNTEILIPVLHSSRKYVSLLNLPSFGNVTINTNSVDWKLETVVQFDIWVATTSSSSASAVSPWAQLQASYANATGYAPLYPYWTTGFWQSKNRYRNQTQLMDVARGYIQRGYPLALIVIDYYSWNDPTGQSHLGDEVLPKTCWPNPRQMILELKEMGVQLMVSPYFHSISPQSKYAQEAKTKHLLAKNASDGEPVISGFDKTYVYDLFQPEARQFAWSAVQRGYIQQYGMHQNWWIDCDEPCYYRNSQLFEHTLLYNNGTWPVSFVGAAYPHMVDLMVWEAQQQQQYDDNDDEDFFVSPVLLGRSAWAGSQRFGGALWSGDTTSNFENLQQQLRAGLNVAMSGIPYWTTDIGGYAGGNIDDNSFRQLLVRWFQYSAFCPFFRNHGVRSSNHTEEPNICGTTNADNEIWKFGKEAEQAIAIMMHMREQLRPYVYDLYRAASERAEPIIRPLFFDFWKDDEAATVEDQFMFGPDYLVAPQLYENATNRSVYLPPGEVWIDYFSDGPYIYNLTNKTKGIRVVVPTPLEKFPVFVRSPLSLDAKQMPHLLRGKRIGNSMAEG